MKRLRRWLSWLRPFLHGMASTLDMGGTFRYHDNPKSDTEAPASDWKAVGDDMWRAVAQFEEENKKALAQARHELQKMEPSPHPALTSTDFFCAVCGETGTHPSAPCAKCGSFSTLYVDEWLESGKSIERAQWKQEAIQHRYAKETQKESEKNR